MKDTEQAGRHTLPACNASAICFFYRVPFQDLFLRTSLLI